MRRTNPQLTARNIGYWGPQRTRKGMFAGLMPSVAVNTGRNLQRRADGRVQLQLTRSANNGVRKLVVSDENMIGTVRQILRRRSIYPAIGERMARYARAFDGRLTRVVLNIRAQDLFWSSAVSYGVARGHRVLSAGGLEKIATSSRTWRDVITDLSCALPDTEIAVLPFERYQGCPDAMLSACINETAPANTNAEWLNRAPDVQTLRNILAERGDISGLRVMGPEFGGARWVPFTDAQREKLREAYAEDMHWLVAGADGLAKLIEPATRTHGASHDILTENSGQFETGKIPHYGPMTRGQGHDQQERHMAGHR
jgi:hypothetical protein